MNTSKFTQNFLPRVALIGGCSLVLGALSQHLLAVGNFWSGTLAASALIFLCGIVLYLAWFGLGCGKILAWMMFLAFVIRVSYGVFLAWGLPRIGYETQTQQAGFVFNDPYRRERSAWALAKSEKPLTEAFSDVYETDQYGGLLAVSAFVYRYISPDAFRPVLISILAAGAMALSIPFLMAALQQVFKREVAQWAGWILALYPEGVLLGSSQMREPFFILFFSILIWAIAQLMARVRIKAASVAVIISAVSLYLLSYRVALPITGVLFLWVWVVNLPRIKKPWIKITTWVVIIAVLIGGLWFTWDWVNEVLTWDLFQTITRSGRIQFHLEDLTEWMHFPFILIYGLFQPVLPAAIAAPAPWIWRSLGIFRSLGWYALLPVLVYALIRVWRLEPSQKKRWLAVMVLMVWVWTIIASARAGGDQWDNPRYRTIFLPWMAAVAGWGIYYAFKIKDRWLIRGLMLEGIFLAFFTQWYISRYNPVIPRLDFWLMIAIIIGLSLAVVVGGFLSDRKRTSEILTED